MPTPWIQLERDLWLFTDGKLYWNDKSRKSEAIIAGSGNFPHEAKPLMLWRGVRNER